MSKHDLNRRAGWARSLSILSMLSIAGSGSAGLAQQTHVSFLWHMHQPIYYPYETIVATDAAGHFSFSVIDVHNQRFGPYTSWPRDAIQSGLALGHLGAQVSFSGSLNENLNVLSSSGINGGMWSGWSGAYGQAQGWTTTLGNPRLDLVAFGYHHPLMPLLDETEIRMQVKLHRHIYGQNWPSGPAYSRGMFPAETAFAERMIPALVAEGIEWILVDNIHFDRACQGYPHTNASNLFAPNRADQVNANPADNGGAWVQLNNLWAPSQVSVPFGYQPHHVEYVNPATGAVARIVAVPAARYEGNEDGRGGYGAFLYDQVMDQYLAYNTDPNHPLLVVLHHDGDNFGGGTDAYYHGNFQGMVNWVTGDPDYDVTTVQDYLDRFPPEPADVIHVEPGSWAGADNGDPEFKKWLGDPDGSGWSPDRNSWAVLVAARNRVFTADAVAPYSSLNNVLLGTGTNTDKAWHYLLVSQASDYWYWDGTEVWDSNATRGCNQAVTFADAVINGQTDTVPPTLLVPQREPYNPGGFEWAPTRESSDFEVWTYVADVSGLISVTLNWRVDADGANPLSSHQNETFAGGVEVGGWQTVAMTASDVVPPAGILTPTYRAERYGAFINGQNEVLIDYYVEAIDAAGNTQRSDIQHVFVGATSTGGGGPGGVTVTPDPAVAGEAVLVSYDPSGTVLDGAGQIYIHYGFDGWSPTISPDPPMVWNASTQRWELCVSVSNVASQFDCVFNNGAGVWDNNGGLDWHFTVIGGDDPPTVFDWQLDGTPDAEATVVGSANGITVYAGVAGNDLYLAAPTAGGGNDHFLIIADTPGSLTAAPWAKTGQVAGWAAFTGNENDNNWAGWFDQSGAAEVVAGGSGWLEATINLADEFAAVPTTVHVAFAAYGTADGSALLPGLQVPASVNGDGHVDAPEFLVLDVCALRVDHAASDLNHDCAVNAQDASVLLTCLGGPGVAPAGECTALGEPDGDEDGDVDLIDFALLADLANGS